MYLPVSIKPIGSCERNDVIRIAESTLGPFHSYFVMKSLSNSRTLVAKVDNKIIGFIMYYTVKLNIKLGVLYYMAVISSYQGIGIGGKLLDEAENNLSRRVNVITASTKLENEKVQKMFKKRGYTVLTWSELKDLTSWIVTDKLLRILHAYDDDIIMMKCTSNKNVIDMIRQLS
ncbi:MAG: GNAT family N-acetyltransferase [Candidatus Methanomethylicia archaeon]